MPLRLWPTYLLHVVIECDAHAFFTTQHLTGHESVEDSRAGQWKAEIEAKQPPVFDILVELEEKKLPSKKCKLLAYVYYADLKWCVVCVYLYTHTPLYLFFAFVIFVKTLHIARVGPGLNIKRYIHIQGSKFGGNGLN